LKWVAGPAKSRITTADKRRGGERGVIRLFGYMSIISKEN
jgi:hypothetical protein